MKLTRETIAATALKIADKHGFDAVSMRRIAAEMDVGTMSLYHYVRTKDELIALMDEALMAEALLDALPRDWKKAMLAIARSTFDIFKRHPWALVSMRNAPIGPNGMRHAEQCLQALAPAKMSDKDKLTLLAVVDDYVMGYTLRASERAQVDLEMAREYLATGALPQLAKVFAHGRVDAANDRFERAIKALLDAWP